MTCAGERGITAVSRRVSMYAIIECWIPDLEEWNPNKMRGQGMAKLSFLQ